MTQRRIGLFGGSFDPVHNGHIALAQAALQGVALDQVLWIPVGRPWQKTRQLAPAEHRIQMLALALAGEPRFRIEPIEVRRPGPSYMLDTVNALQAAGSTIRIEWFLMMGQDQYARLSTWHGWRSLAQRVTFAVAARDGIAPIPDPQLAMVSHRALVIPMPEVAVSSTQVRKRLAASEPLTGMVPPAVERYIGEHGLYRADTALHRESQAQPKPEGTH